MKALLISLFLIGSCAQINSSKQTDDEFEKIIIIMKSKSSQELYQYFGKPSEVASDSKNSNVSILKYKNPLINVYLNKETNNLTHLTFFYWKDFDNYTALKERFKNYKWIESKLQDNSKSDVLTDSYIVKIPEINMEFQYDNNAPKRKVMWIYFD